MNLKKMDQKQAKKVVDALANHPGKKSVKGGVDLEKIAQTLADRKLAKINASSGEEE